MSSMNQVVQQLHAQRKRAEQEIEKLNLAIRALTSINGTNRTVEVDHSAQASFLCSSSCQNCRRAASPMGEDQGGAKEISPISHTSAVHNTPPVCDRWGALFQGQRSHGRKLAEREGFEPSIEALVPYNGLANRRLQPLGHLSVSL